MAKESYTIRTSIDKTAGDMEIALSNDGGITMPPMQLKYIVTYLFSIIALLFMYAQTPVGKGPAWAMVLFGVAWVALTIILTTRNATGQPNAVLLEALGDYWSSEKRRTICRTSSDKNGFARLSAIEDVSDDGLILYCDGPVGRAYAVVGNASLLLFDQDRDMVVDAFDLYWRNVEPTVEHEFVCCKESQEVWRQEAALLRRLMELKPGEEELAETIEAEQRALYAIQGRGFHSIHQYLFLRCQDMETLNRTEAIMVQECRSKGLVFKDFERLDKEGVRRVVAKSYRYKGE